MKNVRKVFCSVLVLSFFATLLSCGEDMNYRKACEKKDWPKAYDIAYKIKEEGQPYYEKYVSANGARYGWALEAKAKYDHQEQQYQEAIRYIVLQEAMTVLDENGENGIMRIIAIAKEHKAESWLFRELIEIAQQSGDESLVSRLQGIRR